jgi:hypothetical protein
MSAPVFTYLNARLSVASARQYKLRLVQFLLLVVVVVGFTSFLSTTSRLVADLIP